MPENKKIGRYQTKVRQGLVPFRYDKDSRGFNLGAFKNWPSGDPLRHPSIARRDAEFLSDARANR